MIRAWFFAVLVLATSLTSLAQTTRQSAHQGHIASSSELTSVPELIGLLGSRYLDVHGNILKIGEGPTATNGFGFVFISDGCQNSLVYAAELSTLAGTALSFGVQLYAVINSPRMNWAEAKKMADELGLTLPVLFDPSSELADRLNADLTPLAYLISKDEQVLYRGRIDDRFVDLGQRRKVIRSFDFEEALKRLAAGDTSTHQTQAVGCFIEDRRQPEERDVTWARDIFPLLSANCNECHRDNGPAPFSLTQFDQAQSRARMLSLVTAQNYMPPWKPDPNYGRFRDERFLTEFQKDLLASWTAQGSPQGSPADSAPAPALPAGQWRLGQPDLVFKLDEPFTVPAEGDDVYRYFVMPGRLPRDVVVQAIDFLPDANTVVHHANFFVDTVGRAEREDRKDAEPGFSVFGTGSFMDYSGSSNDVFGIGGWAPGAEPYQVPEGTGIWLPGGGQIVVEIHYKLDGRTHLDQSQIGLYLAEGPVDQFLDGLLVGTQDIDIPAGETSYIRHVQMQVPEDFQLVDMMPHMHFIGTRARVRLTHPDGQVEDLIGIDDWDLRWQNIYVFRQPKLIPRGSTLDFWFEWDNSDDNFDNPNFPAERIEWGWNSADEMAEVWMGVIPKRWDNTRALKRAADQTWFRTDSTPLTR